ncbi:uncharacterized [Tachysurus ichikawai]
MSRDALHNSRRTGEKWDCCRAQRNAKVRTCTQHRVIDVRLRDRHCYSRCSYEYYHAKQGLQVTNRTDRQWYSKQSSITEQQPIKEEGTSHCLCPLNP